MKLLLAAALGGLGWLCAEYLIHRFLGHARKIRTEFGREHTKHHSVGDYFAPSWKKALMAAQVLLLMAAISMPIAGVPVGAAFTIGFTATYLLYEVLHRRAHTHPPAGPYGRWLRKHHFYHHFHDPKTNHGVSWAMGDWIFRTNVVAARIQVPEKLAMRWLLDPTTGEVFEAFRADYELVRRKAA